MKEAALFGRATRVRGLLLVVATFCFGLVLRGQGTSYISGYVFDASGAAVPGATVTVRNDATNTEVTLTTDTAGLYRTPNLLPGTYLITVTAKGFEQLVRSGVIVSVGQPLGLDLSLTVGSVNQQVQVVGAAPQLRTQDSALGQTVSYQAVESLPMFNRDAGQLIALTPTVRYYGEDHISYGSSRFDGAGIGDPDYFFNGAPIGGDRTDVGQMTYDPPVESIGEARVVQNQYSAQFGAAVGQIVMFQSKQGTNQLHGNLYEYFRNEDLDSYNGFTDTKPTDRENIPGGTIGGPIKKDKLFFFDNFEVQKQLNPEGAVFNVPTAAERQGVFPASTPIYEPGTQTVVGGVATGTQFPGNAIPTTMFDAVAAKTFPYLPLPNTSGSSGNLLTSGGTVNNKLREVAAIDWNISPHDTLHGDYLLDLTTVDDKGWAAWDSINPHATPAAEALGFWFKTQVYNIYETHIFSPNFFTTTQFVYRPRQIHREGAQIDPTGQWAAKLGIKGYAGALLPPADGGDMGFPYFTFAGYEGLGSGDLQFAEYPVMEHNYSQAFTYIHGKQTLGFGVGIMRSEHGVQNQTAPTGQFSFAPTETGLPGVGGTGDSFASFLLGEVDTANTQLGPRLIYHEYYYDTWIEDDIKVTHKLTLNLGFRWDIDAPLYERNNDGNGFDPYATNPVSGTPGVITFLGQNNNPDSFYNTDFHRFAPRVGFAYQIGGNTVIRGGWGIYNTGPTLGANRGAPTTGFTTTPAFNSSNSGITPAFILEDGFPTYPLGGTRSLLTQGYGAVAVGDAPITSPSFVTRNWAMGYAENATLSVQHELPGNMLIEVAGQSVLGRRLDFNQNDNEVPPYLWGISGNNYANRPFPQYGSVHNEKDAIGTSNYYAGSIRFEKRFSNGVNINANYGLQKTLGYLGGSLYYPGLSYGPTLYDEANMPTGESRMTGLISFTYHLPFGAGTHYASSGPAAKIVGGWIVSGIFTRASGQPFDVSSGEDSLNSNGPLGGRVNLVGSPYPASKSTGEWLNKAAFAVPAFGQVGGECCGMFFGPANTEFSASIDKETKITERFGLKFSIEFFNLTNTLQFGNPDAGLQDATFGEILGPLSEGANSDRPEVGQRILQLGLKLSF